MDYTKYHNIDGVTARRIKDDTGDYLKRIPRNYYGTKDLIQTFSGVFQTMITLTFTADTLSDSMAIKKGVSSFQETLQKYLKIQGKDLCYIGVLEYGESQHDKNPISEHFHFMVECRIPKKKYLTWKKTGKRSWGLNSLWCDAIRNEKDARKYVSKYAKGNHIVKDFDCPDELLAKKDRTCSPTSLCKTCQRWKDISIIRSSANFTSKLKNDVSFEVDTELLRFMNLKHFNYLQMSHIRTLDSFTTTIGFDDMDWTAYCNVEIAYLVKNRIRIDSYDMDVNFNGEYWNRLKLIFSAHSDLINIYTLSLESVARPTMVEIQNAYEVVLKSFQVIPKRYNWTMIFSFRQWKNITFIYYNKSHLSLKEPDQSNPKYFTDDDEDIFIDYDLITQVRLELLDLD